MRSLILLLPVLVAACAPVEPPRRGVSTGPAPARAPARPRWQAVPAKADGAVVAGGRRHIVKAGETGLAIAKAYGVPWGTITRANGIGYDAVIRVGQPLFIPTGPAPAASGTRTAARPAKTFEQSMEDVISGASVARSAPSSSAPASAPASRSAPASASASAPPAASAAALKLAWPVDGRVILSGFGPKAGGRVNDGINIKAVRGSPVRAAADGEVIYVGDAIQGFGLLMLVRHDSSFVTAYGHLEDALADRGDKVQRGQPIARAGSSGEAREPQLLFQLRQGRKAIDPRPFLPG